MCVHMCVCMVCKCIFTDDQREIGQTVLFRYHPHFIVHCWSGLDFREDLWTSCCVSLTHT